MNPDEARAEIDRVFELLCDTFKADDTPPAIATLAMLELIANVAADIPGIEVHIIQKEDLQ